MSAVTREAAPFRIGVVADDLTGALDTGAGFARAGMRVRVALGDRGAPVDLDGLDVAIINTASREGDAEVARERSRDATRALLRAGVTILYKKVDSTLRGHPGAELAGMLSVLPPGTRALVAPAFPAQGRLTAGGVQRAFGRPVPGFGGDVRAALHPVADACDVHDVASDDDLAAIATQGIEDGVRVWVGTAGLAGQLVPALVARGLHFAAHDGEETADGPWHDGRPVVVVAGSVHPVTVAQVAALAASGVAHLAIDPRRPDTWPDDAALDRVLASPPVALSLHEGIPEGGLPSDWVAGAVRLLDRVAGALGRRLAGDAGTALVVTGGETAQCVLWGLGATAIDVTGEVLPGVPTGRLHLRGRSVPVVTKSGGFGGPDALRLVIDGAP